MVKKIKNKQGAEMDYVDVDMIMGMLLEEYKS
jgi:hypothetical protein